MRRRLDAVFAFARSPRGRKAIRYSIVSLVSVAVTTVALFALVFFGRMDAARANVTASLIGGVPSYYLNRRWAWGKSGRSHLMKEVIPFWVMTVASIAFSTWAADAGEAVAEDMASGRLARSLIVVGASLAAFGVLWVGKFIVMNKLLFKVRPHELGPADVLAAEVAAAVPPAVDLEAVSGDGDGEADPVRQTALRA